MKLLKSITVNNEEFRSYEYNGDVIHLRAIDNEWIAGYCGLMIHGKFYSENDALNAVIEEIKKETSIK